MITGRLASRIGRLASALALATLATTAAHAQGAKTTRLVVPFAAGSTTDIIARILAPPLGEALGQTIIVEDKPGADGAIGGADVKRSAPDGSTLFLATNSPMAGAPNLQKNIPYDPIADFTPLGHVGNYTFFLMVHADVPAKTFQEFVKHAKANPDAMNHGTGNTSGIAMMGTVLALSDIKLTHVPYKSEPPAVLDLVAGRIQAMVSSYSTVAAHITAGKLRPLLVFLPERSPALPDVPTVSEAGLPRFKISSFCALYGPAGMSKELVTQINTALNGVIAKPDVREQFAKQAFMPKPSSPEELGQITKDQLAIWGEALRNAGIMPQ